MTYRYGKAVYDDDSTYHTEAQLVYVASTNRIWQSVWNITGYDPAPGMWAIIDPTTLTVEGYSTGDTYENDFIERAAYDPVNDVVWSLANGGRILKHDADGTMLLDVAEVVYGPYVDPWTGSVWGYNGTTDELVKINANTGDQTDVRYDFTDGANLVSMFDMAFDADGRVWLLLNVHADAETFLRSDLVVYDPVEDTASVEWTTSTETDRGYRLLYDSVADAMIVWQAFASTYGQLFSFDIATLTDGTPVALTADTNDLPDRWAFDATRNRIWGIVDTGGSGESASDPAQNIVSMDPAAFTVDQTFPVLYEPTAPDQTNVPPNYWSVTGTTLQTVLPNVGTGVYWSAIYYLWRDADSFEINFTTFIGGWEPDSATVRARLYPINLLPHF